MKRRNRISLALTAGAGAAAAYGGYAGLAWLRYGHPRQRFSAPLLDRYIPRPEVIEHQRITVNAPSESAYAASRNLDLTRSRVVRWIFATRAFVMCAPIDEKRDVPTGLIDEVQALGWGILDEVPGREIVVGARCKPWLADPGFQPIPGEDFAKFSEPGWAKIVWNFSVEPVTEHRCIVHTETRVTTTDRDSRTFFRRYWSLVSPGIVLIRRLGLRIIKADAEKGLLV
jgi:hypothetical protein